MDTYRNGRTIGKKERQAFYFYSGVTFSTKYQKNHKFVALAIVNNSGVVII